MAGEAMSALEGQTSMELFAKREPGKCADEGTVADIGDGKSYCIPWGCWTNCREVGHCVYESKAGAR